MEEEAYYLYIVKEVYPHITKVSAFCALFVVLAMIGLSKFYVYVLTLYLIYIPL